MRLRASSLSFVIFTSTFLFSQTMPATPPPQTAREALIEMFTSGDKNLTKHFTVEVQELLNKPAVSGSNMAIMLRALQIQPSKDVQVFPTGPILLLMNNPVQHRKFEIRVDSDDLNGDQDILELSFHSFVEGKEQHDELSYFASHVKVTFKKQQNVWRLFNIGAGMELPVGDAEFLQSTLLSSKKDLEQYAGTSTRTDAGAKAAGPTFDLYGMMHQLVTAEEIFARQNPDDGFTCSLQQLVESGKNFGVAQQIASGTYMGYKWSLSGCNGKPAGSFRIIAEPIALGHGLNAACVDATANLRILKDGHGGNCFTLGKIGR